MKDTRALRIDSALGLKRARRAPRRLQAALARFSSGLIYAIVFGLALGALVHIVTVFVIPYVGSGDAYSRFAADEAELLEPGRDTFNPPWPDPAFVTMVCRFDLRNGPQRVHARAPAGFAGLSLHAPGGGVLYAVTDEVAQDGELSLQVMTPDQAMDIPRGDSTDVRFVMPRRRGMVVTRGLAVYRVMAPVPSLRESVREIASTLRCGGW